DALPAGDSYKAGGVTMLTAHNAPEGTWDVWMTGFLDGACPPFQEKCGAAGKVSYLGGHQYTTSLPISTNPKTQGVRMFLNSLFDSTCASLNGLPNLTFTKTAPATTVGSSVTFTITYANSGPSVALGAVVTDPIPPGSTFVSATNGGVFGGGVVTWNLGNLGAAEFGAVQFTVTLPSFGTYTNTAKLAYKVGLNPFALPSNTTSTLYDKDTDGDGVPDSLDDCPNNFNPAQDLATDVLSCGSCGNICAVANGTSACAGGVCKIQSCNAGFSDCDGAYPDGCEYADPGFASDPLNCGGCGISCSFPNASGSCIGGACALGACNAGHSDCDKLPADGCEYADSGFASDPLNCGGCGKKCANGFVCQAGACVANGCPAGFSDCNGLAADGCEYASGGFASDPLNCGGCGVVCSFPNASASCSAGTCGIATCSAGFVDLDKDPANGCEYACTKLGNNDATCDGVDDDCDGVIDEDYAPSTCGQGACKVTAKCALGVVDCTPNAPATEGPAGDPTCSNGIDDDCDGLVDAQDPNCQAAGCVSAADCDDGNPCTLDACANGFCTHAGIDCDAGIADSGAGGASNSSSSGAGGASSSSSSGAGGASSSSSSGAGGASSS
ncbi:MAG TPA: hypothetical protein VF316_07720, partial [Polyangiaceae bacterium]